MLNGSFDYTTIFNNLPQAYLLLQPDMPAFTIAAASNLYLAQSNVVRNDIIGKPFTQLHRSNTADAAMHAASLASVYNHHAPDEVPVWSHAGKYWQVQNTPVYNDAGSLQYIVHRVTDISAAITGQQKMQHAWEQLTVEHQQLMAIFNQAPVIIAIFRGTDFILEFANARALEMYGVTEEQVLYKPWFQSNPKAGNNGLEELMLEVMNTGVPYNLAEFPSRMILRSDGEIAYLNVLYQPLRQADGSIDSVMVIGEEVTEKVLAKRAVFASEERLNIALEAADMGAWQYDLENGTSVRTIRHDQIFGYPDGALAWSRDAFMEHVLEEDRQLIKTAFLESAVNGRMRVQLRVRRTDNAVRWLNIFGLVSYNTAGKPQKISGIIADITPQKEGEEALRQTTDLLEKKVEERTIALKQANLHLEQSNQRLKEFAYIASHDLQEPVRKMFTFAHFLREDAGSVFSSNSQQMLDRITDAAARMRQLIEDLLSFSNISNSQEAFEKTDINQVVQQVTEDLSIDINRLQATIEYTQLPVVSAVPSQLHQLFQNLISNSLKFARNGEPPLIRIQHEWMHTGSQQINGFAPHAAYVKLTLQDNGIGFEQEHAERIFQLFQRLHGKKEYAGSGIGLAICKTIVDNHKGHIYAKGTPGSGASFTIYLRQ